MALYPYEILGVAEDASSAELRRAYLEKIKLHSPESAPKMFQEISEAYDLVKDEVARARLSLFGIPGKPNVMEKSADLVLDERKQTSSPGVERWLRIIGERSLFESEHREPPRNKEER